MSAKGEKHIFKCDNCNENKVCTIYRVEEGKTMLECYYKKVVGTCPDCNRKLSMIVESEKWPGMK